MSDKPLPRGTVSAGTGVYSTGSLTRPTPEPSAEADAALEDVLAFHLPAIVAAWDSGETDNVGVARLILKLVRPATPPLDVERLTRAIMAADLFGLDGIMPDRWDLYAGTIAKELAREYAALANPDPETT